MTGAELDKKLIRIFGEDRRQTLFAEALGHKGARTVRGWIADEYPVPQVVALLVNLMIKTKAKPEDLRA